MKENEDLLNEQKHDEQKHGEQELMMVNVTTTN